MNYQKNEIMKINAPLIFTIKSGRLKVAENLLKVGASVNEVDEEGYTPIFYSIRNNERIYLIYF
jgi:ankyrin repeat protein